MNILIAMAKDETTASFLTEDNIKMLESLGNVTWLEFEGKLEPEVLRDGLVDIDVVVCGWSVPRFTAEVISKANRLKLIAYVGGSVHNKVSDEMYEKGIRIVCGNEAFAMGVAEGTMAYILASLRHLDEYDIRNCHWRSQQWGAECLLRKTVGLVGYGAISRHLIPMLRPFGVKIKLFSNHTTEEQAAQLGVQKADLKEIFSTCDVVSLHCARSDANFHLVNDELLSSMRDGALLVNTSRGDVVDSEALLKHLQSGRIRAALDVYEGGEPLPEDSPFRKLGNHVLAQPHCGGPTVDFRYHAAELVIWDIKNFQEGKPLENEILPWRAKMMTK